MHSPNSALATSTSFSSLGDSSLVAKTTTAALLPETPSHSSSAAASKKRSLLKAAAKKKGTKKEKEVKVLTNMVQSLAQKLKKRDIQITKLQCKADRFAEATLKLESAEDDLEKASTENASLSRRVSAMKNSIELDSMEAFNSSLRSLNKDAGVEPLIDSDSFQNVKMERDMSIMRAHEMSIGLAESRAETDQLRDSLAAAMELLKNPNAGSRRSLLTRASSGSLRNIMAWGTGKTK